MSRIWFTSDTHGYHKNICRGTSEWKQFDEGSSHQGTRDFNTIEEMNEALLKGINDNVREDDILWHLGDFTFGGLDKIWEFRKQIKCKNIHLVFGNHDHHIENNKILPNCYFNWKEPRKYLSGDTKENLDYDYSWGTTDSNEVKAQDLFSSTQYYKQLKWNKKEFVLMHYAMRVWDRSHKGAYYLYGHSHASLEEKEWGKSMDVGVDNAFRLSGEYRPFAIEEIVDILDERETLVLDHHNENTN